MADLTAEQLEARRVSTENYCRKVYLANAYLKTQMQEIMDGLHEITMEIEMHHIGATGRLMTTKEILEYIKHIQRENEQLSDDLEKLNMMGSGK